jgi:hypothetical protein
MPIGALSHIGLGKETTFGTAVAATDYVRFASESINQTIEQVKSDINNAVVDEAPYYEGMHTIQGDISGDVYPNIIGHFLRSALGAPVSTQQGATAAYQHVFTPIQANFATNCALPSYTLEVNRDLGASNAFQYAGAVVNELDFTFGVDKKILNFKAGILAKSVANIAKTTPTFDVQDAFTWNMATVTLNNVANTNVSSVEIGIKNELDARPTLDGTRLINRIMRNGKRSFPIKLTVELQDLTEYNLFIAQNEVPLQIKLVGANIASTYYHTFQVDLNKFHFNAFPINVSGAGVITAVLDGWAEYDPAAGFAAKFTLINTKTAY